MDRSPDVSRLLGMMDRPPVRACLGAMFGLLCVAPWLRLVTGLPLEVAAVIGVLTFAVIGLTVRLRA